MSKIGKLASLLICAGTLAHGQVNTTITDGTAPFAEGVLRNHVIQANGAEICKNPYVIGRYISCKNPVRNKTGIWHAPSRQRVWVETNGVLEAMIVLDEHGEELCKSPEAWNKFKSAQSYIVCP